MFKLFKEKKEPKNLKEVLSQLKNLKKDFKEISEELKSIKEESRLSIQKVGIVRFNPFKEIGGNQSFSLALLNSNNDGIVITSFYGREGNRIFGKPIRKGRSPHLLSKEEKKAIQKAQDIQMPNQQKKKNDQRK